MEYISTKDFESPTEKETKPPHRTCEPLVNSTTPAASKPGRFATRVRAPGARACVAPCDPSGMDALRTPRGHTRAPGKWDGGTTAADHQRSPPRAEGEAERKKNIYTSSYRQELQDGPTFHNAESHPDCFLIVLSSVYYYLVVR